MKIYSHNYQKKSVTYWSVASVDKFNQPAFNEPVLIDARWEEKKTETFGPDGEDIISNAFVFCGYEVELGGFLAKGDATAYAAPKDTPHNSLRAFPIKNINSSNNLQGNRKIIKAIL